MVYSPPSNSHKNYSHGNAKPQVVADEIDAGAIKLEPPKIRPVSRAPQPRRHSQSSDNLKSHDKRQSTDGLKRVAIHSVTIEESKRHATTTVDLPALLKEVVAPQPTNADLNVDAHDVVRALTTYQRLSNAVDAISPVPTSGAMTHWETPYNKPALDTPENVQYTRLALQYLQQGRIEDAERLYKQALVVAERTFSVGDPAISRAVEDLAGFYYSHEKYKQAEPFVSRLLKQRIEKLSSDDWLLIRTVDQLADVYEKCGEPVQAQALYKFLLARQTDASGHNSPVCAFTLSRLADSYLRQEHFAAAESLLQTILGIQETLHGRCSIEISTTLQELASIYQKLGRYDRAAEMLERLLHVLETIHGDNGLSVASCLLKLADLLNEIEMVSEAEPLYRRAQEIYTLSYGDRTAAHSMFKKKIERVTTTMTNLSKLSKDKPIEQEECSRFPAIRVNLDDMLPSKLGTGQVNRCLGHAISSDAVVASIAPLFQENKIQFESSPARGMPAYVPDANDSRRYARERSADFVEYDEADFVDTSETRDLLDSLFDEFSETGELPEAAFENPAFDMSVTMDMPQPQSDFSTRETMTVSICETAEVVEMNGLRFDYINNDNTASFETSTSFETQLSIIPDAPVSFAPPIDFSTHQLVAPTFNFTPTFEMNLPTFESISRSYENMQTRFEPGGELDSILDPNFASELAKIYETTRAENPTVKSDDQLLPINQQDTIVDLNPMQIQNLERERENYQEPSATKSTRKSRITRVLESSGTTKPLRLSDKTTSLPVFKTLPEVEQKAAPREVEQKTAENPRLTTTVPGLVTVSKTDVQPVSQEQSSLQLRDTVREKPVLLPEPFPSKRRRATSPIFAVTHPGTKSKS